MVFNTSDLGSIPKTSPFTEHKNRSKYWPYHPYLQQGRSDNIRKDLNFCMVESLAEVPEE